MNSLEVEVAKAWSDAEAHLSEGLSITVSQWEKKLESEKATTVEAFHSSEMFKIIKLKFAYDSFLQGLVDYR